MSVWNHPYSAFHAESIPVMSNVLPSPWCFASVKTEVSNVHFNHRERLWALRKPAPILFPHICFFFPDLRTSVITSDWGWHSYSEGLNGFQLTYQQRSAPDANIQWQSSCYTDRTNLRLCLLWQPRPLPIFPHLLELIVGLKVTFELRKALELTTERKEAEQVPLFLPDGFQVKKK